MKDKNPPWGVEKAGATVSLERFSARRKRRKKARRCEAPPRLGHIEQRGENSSIRLEPAPATSGGSSATLPSARQVVLSWRGARTIMVPGPERRRLVPVVGSIRRPPRGHLRDLRGHSMATLLIDASQRFWFDLSIAPRMAWRSPSTLTGLASRPSEGIPEAASLSA